LLVVGLIISNLTARVRDQVDAIQKKHEQTQALFSLSKDLNTEIGLEAILKTIIDHFILTIGKEAAVFLPINGSLEIKFKSSGFPNDKKEYEIAVLAFENNQPTGKGTDTFSTSSIRYQPLKTRQGVLGILAIEPHTLEDFHNPEQSQLLEAFTSLSAMAIERILLTEQAKETQVLRKSEKLQTALLNSISHDLRTPLSTITGVLDSLKESEQINQNTVYLDHAAKLDLIETASEETQRLNRLVGNLLDITKLEAGVLQIHKVETDLQDLISTAISHTQDRLQGHFIKLDIPEKLSGVFLDFILMEQVIMNLLDNAIKYSPAGTTVDIQVRTILDSVQISVSDSGNGIPDEYLSKIFNKFHRIGLPKNISGTGLGLSICKGIIESHGGQIMAENRPEGGARFIITLPIK
jgi:two-component system sensor histidine kinase KdpD